MPGKQVNEETDAGAKIDSADIRGAERRKGIDKRN